MKSLLIVLSVFVSVSSMAAVSYDCSPAESKKASEHFMLTQGEGNTFLYKTAEVNNLYKQGNLSVDTTPNYIRGFTAYSGLVGFASSKPGTMTPKVVQQVVVYVSRALQNSLAKGDVLINARKYSCGMLMKSAL